MIADYLEASAKKYPEKCAFIDEFKRVTYSELLINSQSVATSLLEKMYVHKKPIAVMIDRNVESICAFLGISMTRNFYVPIDVTQPLQRVRTILEQMKPEAVIAFHNISQELERAIEVPVYEYEELVKKEPNLEKLADVRKTALDTDPLYAICTSGSTGVPKGVLISHRSVLDFIPVFVKTFRFTEHDVFGNQAPFDFDVSVKDIYSTIFCGATMYIIPRVCFAMPKLLVDVFNTYKISVIVWAVSALCIVASVNSFKKQVPQYLKKVLFSGEVMPIKMLNIWRKALPDAMYVNLYGPTEITCNCLYYIVDREFGLTEKLPLGISFENESVLVLKENNEPVKPGETGEICVLGTCLALGYYRNPEKTAEAFVQNPLNRDYPELMYRTGDLAELAEDGEYYFAARKDFQIKHMGHRIELEEIETHLNAISHVRRASCYFDTNKNKIVAFYSGDLDKKEIIDALKDKLPKYMIPNIFVPFDELPLNKNGKIDRQTLKKKYLGEE